MEKFKKFLKSALPIAISAIIGYVTMMLVLKNMPEDSNKSILLIKLIIVSISLIASAILHTIMHEGGHLIAGKMSGYSFVSFMVFGTVFIKEEGKIKRKKFPVIGAGGQCLMEPPELKDGSYPYILYNFGGSMMNIILGILFFIAMRFLDGNLHTIFLVTAVMGIAMGIMNITPLKTGGIATDGYNIYLCKKDIKSRYAFWVQLKIATLLSRGVRFRDMTEKWFEAMPLSELNNHLIISTAIMRYSYLIDIEEYNSAREYSKFMLDNCPKMLGIHQNEMRCELLFFELTNECREEEIEKLNTKELKDYLKATSSYLSRQKLLYAYAKIYEKNDIKANKVLTNFEKVCRNTPYLGEVEGERNLFMTVVSNQKLV